MGGVLVKIQDLEYDTKILDNLTPKQREAFGGPLDDAALNKAYVLATRNREDRRKTNTVLCNSLCSFIKLFIATQQELVEAQRTITHYEEVLDYQDDDWPETFARIQEQMEADGVRLDPWHEDKGIL